MWTRQYKQRKTGALIVPAISAIVVTYFSFHAWNGEYGLASKNRLEARISSLSAELEERRGERRELERRISLVADGTIERDTLDELARKSLDLTHADEVVIFLDR